MRIACLFILILLSGVSFAAEKYISVFYPSPYGEYVELRSESLVVGTDTWTINYMDRTNVAAQNGVILVESGLAITAGTMGGNYLNLDNNIGTVRLRVDATNNTTNGDRLIYTTQGRLLIGDMTDNGGTIYKDAKVYIKDTTNEVSIGMGLVQAGDIGQWTGTVTPNDQQPGIRVDVHDGHVFIGGSNGTNGHGGVGGVARATGVAGFVAASSSALAGLVADNGTGAMTVQGTQEASVHLSLSGDTMQYQIPSDAEIGILGGDRDRLTIRSNELWIEPQNAGTGNSQAYINTQDTSRAALYWGTSSQAYGFLGYDGTTAARIGAQQGGPNKLEITTNDRVAISINGNQQVVIASGPNFSPSARFTVQGGTGEDVAEFLGRGNGAVKIDANGRVAMGHSGGLPNTWQYASESVNFNNNGYMAVDDIYIKNPKSGAAPNWVSNLAGVLIDNIKIVSTRTYPPAVPAVARCPKGYLLVGGGCAHDETHYRSRANWEYHYPSSATSFTCAAICSTSRAYAICVKLKQSG